MSLFSGSSNLLSSFSGKRPPFEGAYIYVFSLLIGYAVADLTITKFRPEMLPTKTPSARPSSDKPELRLSRTAYQPILEKNIFNSDGIIPPAKAVEGEGNEQNQGEDGPAVLSSLPLDLMGTIVHANPAKSVATIQMKNKNETASFFIGEQIAGVADIKLIERRKVTFRNLNNNRLEYIEIPEDSKVAFGVYEGKKTGRKSKGEVTQMGKFDFSIKRSDVDRMTADMSSLLTQARMLPFMVSGQVEGYRFVSIKPDSIFAKLGFKEGDIIKAVNDEPVNSPTKAMELYNALKSSDTVQLGVNRNGRDENFNYSIQ